MNLIDAKVTKIIGRLYYKYTKWWIKVESISSLIRKKKPSLLSPVTSFTLKKLKNMNTQFENMALLSIDDYNELKAKADASEDQIKEEAAKIAKPGIVTLKVCFDTYSVSYKPCHCVNIDYNYYDDKAVMDMLDKSSDTVRKWCQQSLKKSWEGLKKIQSTKKDCIELRNRIADLERRILRHTLANVVLSIISAASIIALFTLIQN